MADEAPCTWVVSKVEVPDGYDPGLTFVRATAGGGDYSGVVRRPGTMTEDLVLWTNGKPRVVPEVAHLQWLQVHDENAAGTVLLSGEIVGEQRWVVYLYSGGHQGAGTVTEVLPPAGYQLGSGVAINDRGDVLVRGRRILDGQFVGVLFSPIAAGPQIVDQTAGLPYGLDEDGTVLLRGHSGKPGALWRNGVLTYLEGDGSTTFADAIAGGKTVGLKILGAAPQSQGLVWDRDGSVRELEDGGAARAINARGLIVGSRSTMNGPTAVWRGTKLLAELPYPDGVWEYDTQFVVSDDNQVFSTPRRYWPLRWTCEREGK
ncbi:hypothetical protein JNUCC0626_02940 [Lentzea sp. JNUCC 0626]|uniref:hypothetical protein n=1 Tax=Lentzea sp. JNUCC 0626 TaxID=3367513 RepID=UPI003747C462